MHALILIGACLIIGATAQYIDPFDPNCPYKNGRLLHDPRNHIGSGIGLIGSGYDTPAIGHRVDISVGGRVNPLRRWKRNAYGRRNNGYGRRGGGWGSNDRWGNNDRWGSDSGWGNDRSWNSRRGGNFGRRGGY